MYHHRLGDDPHWALYQQRERLAFTDPPAPTPPRHHHHSSRRGLPAVLAALAIIAVLRADTTPIAATAATTNLGGHGAMDAPRTRCAPHHRGDTTESATRGVARHALLSHQHTKETQS